MIFRVASKKMFMFIVPPLLALIIISFLKPSENLIYGQDSAIFYLIHPFSFWGNPFNSFSSIGFGFAPVFNAENIFLDSFVFVVGKIGLTLPLREWILIFLTITISNYGIILLVNQLRPLFSYKDKVLIILSIMLYWFNPFTISVTFYHFTDFFFFQAILPYIFLVVMVIYNGGFYRPELFLSLLIILIFSPAVYGVYASIILFITVFAFLSYIYKFYQERIFNKFLKRIIFLSISLLIEIYFSLAFLFFINSSGNLTVDALTGGANNFSQIISLWKAESATTQIYRVLSLNAFSWLYNGRGPISYPWFSFFKLVVISGFMVPLLFLIEILALKKKNMFVIMMVILSIIFIIFSTGDNFPFASSNLFLLQIGGPFLLLTNPFYFSMQIYVFTLSILLFLVLDSNTKIDNTNQKTMKVFNGRKLTNAKLNIAKERIIAIISIILAMTIIMGSLIPVLQNGEFMTHGPNEDSFVLPSSFYELSNFIKKNYSAPDYYVVVLPFSRIGAIDMKIGNGSFYDSMNIFQQILPYPVLDWAVTNETIALDNIISSNTTVCIDSLLRVAHVKYVVINPYVNMSEWFMDTTPNGCNVNISSIEDRLIAGGLMLNHIGKFIVFTVPNVNPIALIYTEQDFIVSSSWNQYLEVMSQIKNSSSMPSQLLLNSVPVIISSPSLVDQPFIRIFSVNQTGNTRIPTNTSNIVFGLNNGGHLVLLNNTNKNEPLSIYPKRIFNANQSNMEGSKTNFYIKNTSLITRDDAYSYLWMDNLVFSNNATITGNITFSNISGNFRWINFYLNSSTYYGELMDEFSIVTLNGTNYIQSSLYYNHTSIQNRVTWDSTKLPQKSNKNIRFSINLSQNLLNFSVTETGRTYSIVNPINPLLVPPGGGINNSLAVKLKGIYDAFSQYNLGITSVNNNETIQNLSVYKFVNLSELFVIPVNVTNTKVIKPTGYSINNGYEFNIGNIYTNLFPVFFAESNKLVNLKTESMNLPFDRINVSNLNAFMVNASLSNGKIYIVPGNYNSMSYIIYFASSILVALFLSLVISVAKFRKKNSKKAKNS